jgi:hypothetical protein
MKARSKLAVKAEGIDTLSQYEIFQFDLGRDKLRFRRAIPSRPAECGYDCRDDDCPPVRASVG